MKEDAQAKGHIVETVCANDLQIKPCAGCMACRTKGECLLSRDDSQRVLKMIQDADAVTSGEIGPQQDLDTVAATFQSLFYCYSFHASVGKAFDPAALQAQMMGFYRSLCK